MFGDVDHHGYFLPVSGDNLWPFRLNGSDQLAEVLLRFL
jgi:hypothetical protein